MSIHLTPTALDRARRFLAASPQSVGLRFGVKKTGCSGWGYEIDVADARHPDDTVFEQDGIAVLVNPQSLPLVDGTQIDFVRKGLNQEFVFDNPNAAAACGCGESFTTVDKPLPG